jgi:hypothetical protein
VRPRGSDIVRASKCVREHIGSAGLGQRKGECAGQDVIAPVDVLRRRIWERIHYGLNKLAHNEVERLAPQRATSFGRIVHIDN